MKLFYFMFFSHESLDNFDFFCFFLGGEILHPHYIQNYKVQFLWEYFTYMTHFVFVEIQYY